MIDENSTPADNHQPDPVKPDQPPLSSSGFSRPDDIEPVGAPAHLADAEEVPDWLSSVVMYIFALPMALVNGLSALSAALYGVMGMFSVLFVFLVVLCLLLACLLTVVT